MITTCGILPQQKNIAAHPIIPWKLGRAKTLAKQ
jgi:hypothetical protein